MFEKDESGTQTLHACLLFLEGSAVGGRAASREPPPGRGRGTVVRESKYDLNAALRRRCSLAAVLVCLRSRGSSSADEQTRVSEVRDEQVERDGLRRTSAPSLFLFLSSSGAGNRTSN